jgi:hypothetical protein
MKVLIGVDPHKVSLAVAAVDEATGELLERAAFPQDRTGLRCLDALAIALAASRNERLAAVDPEAASEVLRLLSERREDLVAERTRALNRLHALPCGTSSPAGRPGSSRPTGPHAYCAAYGPRMPRPASDGGWPLRCCA